MWHIEQKFLLIGLIATRFFFRLKGGLIAVVYTESYSTEYRAVALTTLGASGRIFSAISPFVVYEIYVKNNYLPFLVFAWVCLIPAVALLTYPVEATGKELDDQEILYHAIPEKKAE